jgi:hypothetical protein
VTGGARFTATALIAATAIAGCSSDPGDSSSEPAPERRSPSERLRASHCPAELSNCRTASGRILYVERVDPDGDGDAHFVLASGASITAPGVSIIDVKASLRPRPLPGPGDRLSAAGPVQTGSFGQRQIEAVELHVARRARRAR